jgi:hypothetical protein
MLMVMDMGRAVALLSRAIGAVAEIGLRVALVGDAADHAAVARSVSPARLTTVTYGKARTLDPGHDEAAWARNRRVEFVVKR